MEILNISKLLKDAQGNGRLVTDSQGRKRMSSGDLSTGMFHQTRVTVGDTTCSVKGELSFHSLDLIQNNGQLS